MKKYSIIVGIFTVVSLLLQTHNAVADEPEIVNRTAYSNTYSLGNGRYSIESSVVPINYFDGESWSPIDTTLVPSSTQWDYEMTSAGYSAYLRSGFNEGQIVSYEKSGEYIRFQPMNLQWTNDLSQIQQINSPQDIEAVVDDNTIYWNDAYGSGLDFKWLLGNTRLSKQLIINQLTDLPPPAAYIVSGGNPVLELSFIFDPSDINVIVDGESWDKKNEVTTFDTVLFQKDGEALWGIMPQFFYDADDNVEQSVTTIDEKGGSYYVSVKVPYSWLQTASYPVVIDPTIDEQVDAGAKDGWYTTDGFYTNQNVVKVGYEASYPEGVMHTFTTFSGVAPEGTITTAYVSTHQWYDVGSPQTKIYANDIATPVSPTNAGEFDALVLTTNAVDWDGTGTGESWNNSPSLVDVIQELVDSYTVNGIMIIHMDDGSAVGDNQHYYHHYEYSDNTYGMKLYIEYEVGGALIPTVTTGSASSIEDTTATCAGNVTNVNGANVTARFIQWGTSTGTYTANTTESGDWAEGTFSLGLTSLPAGTTIYYRAGATNSEGNGYGDESTFLTKPAAPTSVSATDGVHTDKVVVTWVKSTGATGYRVYEDSNLLDTLGDVATYDDTAALAGTISNAGTAVASDATNNAHVALTVSGETTTNGASRTYQVIAFNATGDSDNSSTDTGYRCVGAITYQWQRSSSDADADYSNVDGATTEVYNDTAAPVGTFTDNGTATASDGTNSNYVTLSIAGEATADGDGRYYQCILTATGASNSPQTSGSDRGNRGVGSITYQWMRSSADSDADYSNIGGTTDPYNDTTAPPSEAGRYFKATLSADGAVSVNTTADRGYRAMSAGIGDPSGLTLTDLGGNQINASWDSTDNATSYLLLVSRTGYPTSTSGYEVAFSGNSTSENLTGYELSTITYYFSLWATNGVDYSGTYDTEDIGGNGMDMIALIFLAVALSIGGIGYRSTTLSGMAAIGWLILGAYSYGQVTLAQVWADWHFYVAFASIVGAMPLMLFTANGFRDSNDEDELTEDEENYFPEEKESDTPGRRNKKITNKLIERANIKSVERRANRRGN